MHAKSPSPLRYFAVVLILPLLCLALTAAVASVAEAHPPLRHIVTQCILHPNGSASDCQVFIVAANPQPSELHEATATHRYITTACVLLPSGAAQYCVRTITPVGDQIITR